MNDYRNEKIKNMIKELSAQYIETISGNTSMITITRTTISDDRKRATILISVLPKSKENAAYGFIKRNLGDLRKHISKNLKIRPIPFLDVEIDNGEKNRQKIDELLAKS